MNWSPEFLTQVRARRAELIEEVRALQAEMDQTQDRMDDRQDLLRGLEAILVDAGEASPTGFSRLARGRLQRTLNRHLIRSADATLVFSDDSVQSELGPGSEDAQPDDATASADDWSHMTRAAAIRRFLYSVDRPVSPREIRAALNAHGWKDKLTNAISSALDVMSKRGTVVRTHSGWAIVRDESDEEGDTL